MPLEFNRRPDGYGWLYGHLTDAAGNHLARVEVMPPVSEWAGDVVCPGYEPGVEWVVYLDGEEVARVEHRSEIEAAVSGAVT